LDLAVLTKVFLTAKESEGLIVDEFEGETNDIDEILLRYAHAL
jgi:hypothetical protein